MSDSGLVRGPQGACVLRANLTRSPRALVLATHDLAPSRREGIGPMLPTVAPLVAQITGVAENEWQRVVAEHAVLNVVDYGPLARSAKTRALARGIGDTFGDAPRTAARRLPALPHAYRLARRLRYVHTSQGVRDPSDAWRAYREDGSGPASATT